MVAELLERHQLRADKRFGQNFLMDAHYLQRIVQAAQIQPGDRVYEVGPGLGVLTQALAQAGGKVTTLELDRRLAGVLAETLAGLEVEIIWGDALRFDWGQVPPGSLFAANLPYNVATALITQLLLSGRFRRIVALVQKEVALRMVAQPGTAAYGVLSLRVQYHARVQRLFDLPPGVFFPPPRIDSSLVALQPNGQLDRPALFRLIEAAFGQRRKTLRNNLTHQGYLPAEVDRAIQEVGLAPGVRGEALSLQQFVGLLNWLESAGGARIGP